MHWKRFQKDTYRRWQKPKQIFWSRLVQYVGDVRRIQIFKSHVCKLALSSGVSLRESWLMSDAVVCGLNREDEDVTSSLMKVLWPSSEDSVENSDNHPRQLGANLRVRI